jgi:hypothetical protein
MHEDEHDFILLKGDNLENELSEDTQTEYRENFLEELENVQKVSEDITEEQDKEFEEIEIILNELNELEEIENDFSKIDVFEN